MFFFTDQALRSIRALCIVTLLLAYAPAICHAVFAPQFIKVNVLNAENSAPIRAAVITTTDGQTFSNQNGSFTLRLPPNPFDLIASAPGYRSNMATAVFAGPGQTVTVTIRLFPTSITTKGTLQGRVITAGTSPEPISGALVFTDLGIITVTDMNGYFTAEGSSGTAAVTASARGYASKTVKNVRIPPLGLRSITVRLPSYSNELTGPVSGSVRDACTDQPLEGITIYSSNEQVIKTTDRNYSINAPPGRTALLACGEGYQCRLKTAIRGFLPFGTIVNFALVPLNRGIGTVTGAIIDNATGLPVAGVRIATDTQDITFTDENGEYTLRASPCAELLMITAKGYQPYSTDIVVADGLTTEQDAALAPLTNCMVTGTVTSLLTGLPVAGAQILADGSAPAFTDAAGAYSMDLPSCTAVLAISAEGFFSTRRMVFSSSGAAVIPLDIRIFPCLFCRFATGAAAAGTLPDYQ